MTDPIYAIGDIHGHIDKLERALALVDADGGPDAHIVFMGDYVDRGPDSKAVIDRLIDGKTVGRNWTFLKGNHDRMFEWFLEDFPREDPHLPVELYYLQDRIGGSQTLASYGVDAGPRARKWDVHQQARIAVPSAHIAFLQSLKSYHAHGPLLFVHAGIRPGVPLGEQSDHDLMWIRQGFVDFPEPHPWLVVHGHTAIETPTHFGNRVDLDGGAAYGRALVPVVFEGREATILTDNGRAKITQAGIA